MAPLEVQHLRDGPPRRQAEVSGYASTETLGPAWGRLRDRAGHGGTRGQDGVTPETFLLFTAQLRLTLNPPRLGWD